MTYELSLRQFANISTGKHFPCLSDVPLSCLSQPAQTEFESYQNGLDYDPRQVRIAVVHTREDVVGIFSMLSDVSRLLRRKRRHQHETAHSGNRECETDGPYAD